MLFVHLNYETGVMLQTFTTANTIQLTVCTRSPSQYTVNIARKFTYAYYPLTRTRIFIMIAYPCSKGEAKVTLARLLVRFPKLSQARSYSLLVFSVQSTVRLSARSIRMHTHKHKHTHRGARAHTHTHAHAREHTHTHAHTHTHTHTHTYTHTHACTDTRTRARAHTHT